MTLAPYVVGVDGPFGPEEAAHLLRRASFGATPAERAAAVAAGLDATVAQLLRAEEGRAAAQFAASGAQVALRDELAPMQGAWLARMVATQAPLAERIALLWHGHFATSLEKVQRGAAMWAQYELFRAQGGGPFGALAEAVARDPAMVAWLDNESNEKTHPNENFARELFELFTLGLGRYDEHDVREAARCFTGWHLKEGRFWFNERANDSREKRLFGRVVQGGEEVVALAVAQPACAEFLAVKIARAFLGDEPDAATLAEVAAALREEQLALAPLLARLFRSRLFFAAPSRNSRIASPVEWAVGLLRRTGARAKWSAVGTAIAAMGQSLFAPPNVKGWEGGRGWISSLTLLERGRFAAELAYGGALGIAIDWERLAGDAIGGGGGAALVARLADALLGSALEPASAARLAAFADSPDAASGVDRVRRVAHLLMAAPEGWLA